MKKLLLSCLVAASSAVTASADTLVQWDFNFPTTGTFPATNSTGTGTLTPYIAITSVTFTNIGGTTNTFGATQSNNNSDPWVADNSAFRVGQFPAATSGNKTAGIQFTVNTVGYENIQLTFDQENSATASRYWRVQYTTNGTTWKDHVVLLSADGLPWIQKTVDFGGVAGVKNNAKFGVRYVSEFQSTATGAGAASYIANQTGSTYSANGTLWVDMVTVSGTVLDTNNIDPVIGSISAKTTRVDTATSPIAFTVSDVETPADSLVVTGQSSNPTLAANLVFGGSGTNRTLTITPEAGQTGTATITVRVTDGGGKFTETTFVLTVLPANTAPTITAPANQTILVNSSTTNIAFKVSDLETPDALTVTATAVNGTLLAPSGISFTGTGTNRTIKLTPVAEAAGATWVSVVVSDGTLSATNGFMLKVTRSQIITLWNFNSVPSDTNTSTGTLIPAIGSGTANSVGTTTNSLGSVGVDFDPAPANDNSKWRFGSFPAQGTENKTSGAEFRVSTVNYKNIAVSWDHYNSATGSRFWRLQYSLDGSTFIDSSVVYTNPVETTWYPTGGNFLSIPGANNNPNFAIRIVSEFESTATGAGGDNYLTAAVGGGYTTGGTLWLDMVTISGDLSVSVAPTLQVMQTNATIQISWPTNATGYALEATDSLSPTSWQAVVEAPAVSGDRNVVTVSSTGGTRFFRLKQ